MKQKVKVSITILSVVLLFSCDYETHVINTVHEDGSVTRKVIVKNDTEREFEPKNFRVPIDSTWTIEYTEELNENNDTIWILTAEKHFASMEGINEEYNNDKGSNRSLKRRADFSKSFKWFTTVFRYSETVEKVLTVTCPASDFLSEEELAFFYLPDNIKADLKNGSDSLRYRALSDTVDTKSENWMLTGIVRQYIEIFYNLFGDHPGLTIDKEEMSSKESEFVTLLYESEQDGGEDDATNHTAEEEEDEEILQAIEKIEHEESIEVADDIELLVTAVLGKEFYVSFKTEIDSALAVLETVTDPFFSAQTYDMEIRMPGRIIATNGYADTNPESNGDGGILWTVQGDYFFLETYEMWVESKISNYWAWIVTGIFVLFVITGLLVRSRKGKS
jgi:hypothetical protein